MKGIITALRIERSMAGNRFPYDKVYFVHCDDESHISRIFKYSLVFRVSDELFRHVDKITISKNIGKLNPLRRFETTNLQNFAEMGPIVHITQNPKDYRMVIPVLFLGKCIYGNGEAKKIYPQYLHARCRMTEKASRKRVDRGKPIRRSSMAKLMEEMSLGAYFLSDGEKIEPICAACPKSLYNLTGVCRFGDLTCFENLTRAGPSTFVSNMKRFVAYQKKIDEAPLESHGDLQRNAD